MKKSALLYLASLFSYSALVAQPDIAAIKKEISIKGIKSITKTDFSDNLFIYFTKKDTGVWDHNSKTILFQHIKEIKPVPFQISWIKYSIPGEHGIFDITSNQKLVNSTSPFITKIVYDSNLVSIISPDILGFLDRKRNAAYWVPASFQKDTTFYDAGFSKDKCWYDAKTKEINYGYGNNDDQYYLDVTKIGFLKNYVKVSNDYNGTLLEPRSGKPLKEYIGIAKEWKDYIVITRRQQDNNDLISFLDKNLENIFVVVPRNQFRAEHFKRLLDKNISNPKHVEGSIYLCQVNKEKQFFSIEKMEPVSGRFKNVIPMGYNFFYGGYNYFTVSPDSKFGLFNTRRGEEVEPKYSAIETRAFPDGTHWYRADDTLFKARENESDSIKTRQWNSALSRGTMILNHISLKKGKVILSSATTTADTHDPAYYTATEFEEGSGVFNLTDSTWLIKPRLHSIVPFQEHYVTMKIGSSYKNPSWLQTTILNQDFKPITERAFGLSFVFNDMLFIMEDASPTLIEYDLTKNRIKRVVGTLEKAVADFRIVDGYLLLVDNNYSRHTDELIGMDIMDIITPAGQLVTVPAKRYRYVDFLGNDLLIIGRIPDTAPLDVHTDRLKVDAHAIFDIRSSKIITPWVYFISKVADEGYVYYSKSSQDEESKKIMFDEIRATFKD